MTRRILLAVLALALVAPAALASVPRSSSAAALGASELAPPSRSLERALATDDDVDGSSRFALFAGDELRPQLTVFEPSYPETRVGAFDFLGSPLVGVSSGVSHELHWGCGDSRLGTPEGIGKFLSEDPLGDVDSPNRYAYVGWRPNEATDPLGTESIREWFGADEDISAGRWSRGYGKKGLYFAWNAVTLGFLGRHDAYFEAYDRGQVSRSSYWANGVGVSAVRSAAIGGVAYATGGLGAGLAEGLGLGYVGSMTLSGAVAGAGTVLGTDLIDVGVLHDRDSFSSPGTYALGVGLGAGGGFLLARVNLFAWSVSRGPNLAPTAGDADFVGPVPKGSWRLVPNRAGHHLIERSNVTPRTALQRFNQPGTPRYYPDGTPEAAGMAHLRLHQALDGVGLARSGGNPGLSEEGLLQLLSRGYSTPGVAGVRGALRTPTSSYVAATGIGPRQALGILRWWGTPTRTPWFNYYVGVDDPRRRVP